jgi:Mg-chelatase subunit ChlD
MTVHRMVVLAAILTAVQSQDRVIKVDVNLVPVNVSVTDARNRYVQGLSQKSFHVWEDKVEQTIRFFSTEDAPITLGIIVDKSGSMGVGNAFPMATADASSCLRGGVRDDEYFMIEFNNRPQLVADFTTQMSRLSERLLYVRPGGRTALWDAIYMGVAKLEGASNSRKALVILTDGIENHSRYTLGELKTFLREKDVRIYFFREGVDQLANLTGGRVFTSSNPCEELKSDLSNQYVIGYEPTNTAQDGKWRDIRVRVDSAGLPKELSNLSVRARAGYYAASPSDADKE